MGIYPDVEKKKQEFRKAAMKARVKRDEAEMQDETLHTESCVIDLSDSEDTDGEDNRQWKSSHWRVSISLRRN